MDKNIRSYFDNHPTVDTFYFTSDGYAFFNESDAHSHAKSLDDADMLTVERYELGDETE